jgi:hypothetical protein
MITQKVPYTLVDDNSIKELIRFLLNFSICKGDDKFQDELFSILNFIAVYCHIQKYTYPITILWNEYDSPDFIFKSNKLLGIEHTRGTLENYKNACAQLNRQPEGAVLELSFYSPTKKLKKNDINIGIRKKGERLIGLPWIGNQPEREWVITMINAINQKINKISKYFINNNFDSLELIIQDQSPVGAYIHFNKALDLLQFEIKGTNFIFNKIHLLSKNDFVYDLQGEFKLLDISKINLAKIYAC